MRLIARLSIQRVFTCTARDKGVKESSGGILASVELICVAVTVNEESWREICASSLADVSLEFCCSHVYDWAAKAVTTAEKRLA